MRLLTAYTWTSSYWTAKSSFFFWQVTSLRVWILGPPGVDFLDHNFFIILKKSGQDPSNEVSNFILSSQEVGHWVAQTYLFFDKLPEMTNFELLYIRNSIKKTCHVTSVRLRQNLNTALWLVAKQIRRAWRWSRDR